MLIASLFILTKLREKFFTYRVTMPRNALLIDIIESKDVNQFKNRLNNYIIKERTTFEEALRLGKITLDVNNNPKNSCYTKLLKHTIVLFYY